MTETPAPAAAPAEPAPVPAPAAAPANKQAILRAFYARINAGEFDLAGGKDFHRFVVKEIYPLLADGTLKTDDLEKIAEVFAVRANPYKTKED